MKAAIHTLLAGVVALATCVLSGPAQASLPPVAFADANLEAAIRGALAKPTGPLTTNDLLSLTSLLADNRSISNLSGLEAATNLQALSLYNNLISDVAPLAGLVHLQQLHLAYNEFSDASSLSGLTNLTELYVFANNSLANLDWLPPLVNLRDFEGGLPYPHDLAPVAGLTNLTILLVRSAAITNLSAVTNLVRLQSLDLAGCKIQDITPLAGMTNLTALMLHYNSLTNLEPLAGLVNLQTLWLSFNPFADFTPVAGLTNLGALWMSENGLTDLGLLHNLTQLSTLDLRSNPLGDLAPIAGLTNLTVLLLDDCSLTNVSIVSCLPILQNLSLDHNRLGDLTSLAGLRWPYYFGLTVEDNLLTNITTLLNVPHVDYLYLRGNLLDLSPHSEAMTVIQTLQSRGAQVVYRDELQVPVIITCGPSKPAVLPAGQRSFRFGTQSGVKYTIEFKESLTNSWEFLIQILGDGGMATVLDSDQPGRNRFYRVRAE